MAANRDRAYLVTILVGLSLGLAALRSAGGAPPPPVADEVTGGWRMGLFQTSSKPEATGVFLWLVSPQLK
jgi:hypothetical protein